MKKNAKTIKTWQAFVLVVVFMSVGYVFAAFKAAAPFEVYTWGLVASLGIYAGKRIAQKHPRLGGNNGQEEIDLDNHRLSPADNLLDSEELQAFTED